MRPRRSAGRRRTPDGPAPPPRARVPTPGPAAGAARRRTTWVAIGSRPDGQLREADTSRSPNTVIATVRGMGVAVITRTCGGTRPRLRRQRGPLLHAEPVLLVHDDEPEVGEGDRVLQQRVGADDDARLAGDDVEQLRRRAADALGAGEQRHPGRRRPRRRAGPASASGPSIARDRAVVLGREHLGRREQRGLSRRSRRPGASPAGPRPSCPRRPRPAAAGASGGRAPGRRRSARRPRAARRSGRTAAARRRRPGAGCARGPAGGPAARPPRRGAGPAPPGGRRPPRTAAARPPRRRRPWSSGRWIARRASARPRSPRSARRLVGQRVRRGPASWSSTTSHGLAHLPGRDRLAGRVDRDEGTGEGEHGQRVVVHAVGQQLVLGVRELPLAVEPAELPGEQAPPAHGQLPLAPLLVEEGQRHRGLPVADRRLEDRPAPLPHGAHGDLGDLGHHGDLLALAQGRQVGQLAARRVPPRVVAEQVLDGAAGPSPLRSASADLPPSTVASLLRRKPSVAVLTPRP